jgi:hypothetical protein
MGSSFSANAINGNGVVGMKISIMAMVFNVFPTIVQKVYCHIKQLGQWLDSML